VQDGQETDALVDDQIHDLKHFAHEQDKRHDEKNYDKAGENFSEYVAVDDFLHIMIESF
jgi:hypothetical protein